MVKDLKQDRGKYLEPVKVQECIECDVMKVVIILGPLLTFRAR